MLDTNGDTVAIVLGVDENTPVASHPDTPKTYGQSLVGTSNDPKVYRANALCAQLIDAMNELRSATDDEEVKRLASIAITEIESASMWIVKALTK